MMIKTFEGNSLGQVLKDIKKDFGKEAVILSTEEKFIEGSAAKYFEVKAAVPEHPSFKQGASVQKHPWSLQPSQESDGAWFKTMELSLGELKQVVSKEKTLFRIESLLKEMRLVFNQSVRHMESKDVLLDVHPVLFQLHQHLTLTHLDPAYRDNLIHYLKKISIKEAEQTKNVTVEEYYKAQAIRWMLNKIHLMPRFRIQKGQTYYHALVGPTGSGKSMMIAKIAAFYAKHEGARVGLVCMDDKRIGAAESLRVFAKILSIPMVFVSSPKDFIHKTATLRDCDFILIDTPGFYPKNDLDVEVLKDLKTLNLALDFHIVLSLCEKEPHLDGAIRGFSSLGLTSLIFTKLDESWTYGELFNLSQRWSLPLSYFSTGQNVPEDIEIATKERVIERILQV